MTRRLGAATAVLAAGLAVFYAAGAPLGADYDNAACRYSPACDDPAPAIDAVGHLRIGDFFSQQPIAGPVSVVARAPFVRTADALGADLTDEYRAGALACLLALAAFAVWLAALARSRGAPVALQLVLVTAVFVNPLTSRALFWGHPEDFIAAPLAVAGVLVAAAGAPVAAGVLLGLAVATKLWAGLALLVALGAAVGQERRLLGSFAVVAGGLLGIMLLGDPGRFLDGVQAVGRFGALPGTLRSAGAWYAFSHETSYLAAQIRDGVLVLVPTQGRVISSTLAHVARAAILVSTATTVAVWWWRNPPERRVETAAAVTALVFLVRSTLEPGNLSYYLLPFFLALLAWEGAVRPRIPVACAAAAGCLLLLNSLNGDLSAGAFNAVYLGFAAAGAVYLGAGLFRRVPSSGAPR